MNAARDREAHVVILGGGPAGVGGAYQLRRRGRARVTLLEQQSVVGGNAGSFEIDGLRVDYGSHRLHASCDPEILADISRLLDGDLASYPRHGRIRLRGKWLHFPLKPLDLLLRLDRGFALGSARDMVARMLPHRKNGANTFASVLLENLGPTICNHFYFPYAWKMWGRPPEELSAIQARRRVSAGTFAKLARRVMKPVGEGRYYYPKRGYGQISEAYAAAARAAGADLMLGWKVTRLQQPEGETEQWKVFTEREGEQRIIEADYVWSTIPISLVARMIAPEPPHQVLDATRQIDYRAMILVYLQLDMDQFTKTDAHYFPEAEISLTRLSEPKNYARLSEPRGRTVLCGELPCSVTDAVWTMSDAELAKRVVEDMARAGLPLTRPPVSVRVRRLRQAYPIYQSGYERPLGVLNDWVEKLPRFLSYGRQGLFAHDNTHHALYMAYAAVDCLENGAFDENRWNDYRKVFATHVVED
ncbi:MAG: NAD(P)/FAD-dependent oxidoreductase [Gemmatimonadaceae bacterium]